LSNGFKEKLAAKPILVAAAVVKAATLDTIDFGEVDTVSILFNNTLTIQLHPLRRCHDE